MEKPKNAPASVAASIGRGPDGPATGLKAAGGKKTTADYSGDPFVAKPKAKTIKIKVV